MRPLCPVCKQKPCAIAYTKNDKTYYQNRCGACIKRGKKLKMPTPRWQLDGYKKKTSCDKCGFKARYSAQLIVFHVDGDMTNSSVRNLKTICQNCAVEIKRADLPWRPGDLQPDA
jgi:hypothetical protein